MAAIQVSSSVAAVGSARIVAADGTSVGDVVDVASTYPDSNRADTIPDGTEIARAWSACVAVDGTGIPDAQNCVLVVVRPSSGPVTSLFAPFPSNWGL
jgi:hypothetical protein